MLQLDSVHVSPYVASAIVEHAKRRLNAAGYLLGTRTNEEIMVLDYVPMTHSGSYHDVTSKAYADERLRRIENKRSFFKHQLIGWYSAGNASDGVTEEQFREWCEAPACTFAGKPARKALYIHCAMPGTRDAELAIRWSAYITLNRLEDDPSKTGKPLITCQRRPPLRVIISTLDDAASNVMLNHVVAQALHNGASLSERNPLLNLDEVAFRASTEGKPVADALTETQRLLHQSIVKAKEVHASAASRPEDRRTATTVLDSVQQIRKMKHELEQQQQQNPSSREDFITQRFKDALMIKAVTILLRKQLGQIEALAGQYHEKNEGNAGKNAANANATAAPAMTRH